MIYLIDYENIKNLTGICELKSTDRVIIFYTKNANTLTFDEHLLLAQTKAEIEYKKVSTGNNALDFQLSSYLGFLIGQNFTDFCIISKDRGYDSIIEFWTNEKNIIIKRLEFFGEKELEKVSRVKTENTKNVQNSADIKDVLSKSSLNLKPKDIQEIIRIVNQYKTRQAINSNLQKYFKDNDRVGAIYKILKPFLKGKK